MSLGAQIADFDDQGSKPSDSSFSPATVSLAFTGAAVAYTRGIEPAFASQVCSLLDELVRQVSLRRRQLFRGDRLNETWTQIQVAKAERAEEPAP